MSVALRGRERIPLKVLAYSLVALRSSGFDVLLLLLLLVVLMMMFLPMWRCFVWSRVRIEAGRVS